jgi:hypothetical protein
MFALCTLLLMAYQLNKRATITMADALAERRRQAGQAFTTKANV